MTVAVTRPSSIRLHNNSDAMMDSSIIIRIIIIHPCGIRIKMPKDTLSNRFIFSLIYDTDAP